MEALNRVGFVAEVWCTTPVISYPQFTATMATLFIALSIAGFSILPAMAIKSECADGRLRAWPIGEPEIRRKVFVATQSDRPMAVATAAIESLCREILRQLVIEGSWEAKLASV